MTAHTQKIQDPRQWLGYIPQTLQSSPLYTHLYAGLEQDQEIYALLTHIDKDQPILILFFSIVNFLVLRDRQHPFAEFYPYLHAIPRPAAQAYPFFRDFCLTHLDEIRSLLTGTRLQTNEVTRCANLLPAFELVSQRSGRQPLACIELGASAGLNLNWSRFGYHYGSIVTGEPQSFVQIQCMLEGGHCPPIPATLPPLAQCQGIEVFPVDIHQERDVRWLRACIWPEEMERYLLLDAAIAVAQDAPPTLFIGDACDLLPARLNTVPHDQSICLWHSFALNQGPVAIKAQIEHAILQASLTRTISRISLEADPTHAGRPRLELLTYRRGVCEQQEWLATCTIHGERMHWHASSS